jgi:ankyrin repeat protein
LKDVIEGMLRNGVSINGQNAYGETALHCTFHPFLKESEILAVHHERCAVACWKGNARAVAILLKNGAHVYAVNKYGCLPSSLGRLITISLVPS